MAGGYPIGQPPVSPGAQSAGPNTRLMWVLIGAGVFISAVVVVASFYVVGRFVGSVRAEVSRQTLAREYDDYYEGYELPNEPMFSPATTPMERVGNSTRAMLRHLLTAQAYAAEVEAMYRENAAYSYASFASEAKFRRALELLDSLAEEYTNVAEAHAAVPTTFLAEVRKVATDEESQRFFKEQERFHREEAEVYAEESKIIHNIVTLEKERANLLWANRRHLEEDRYGYATLKQSAPKSAKLRLVTLDSLINEQAKLRKELQRRLRGAFNEFYYTITGQREDFVD
ncbi:MAG: hypothetical protein C4341_02540 [Armatimonadota bacterium]